MKVGILKEYKSPPDRRVVLTPKDCEKLKRQFPDLEIFVESSEDRIFKDHLYTEKGASVVNNLEHCDLLLGVKEVPIAKLIPHKKYCFFSHTIKKQPYNKKLLQQILHHNIELYDHEAFVNTQGKRLVMFGRYAGIVGCYNAFRTLGLKHHLFKIPKACELNGINELIEELKKIELPPIKVVVTGKGSVGMGVKELIAHVNIKEVDPNSFLSKTFEEAVYTQIDVLDYNKRKDGTPSSFQDFYNHPENYTSDFTRFTKEATLLIAGHYHKDGAPIILSKEDLSAKDQKITTIADISCDLNGPIAATLRASRIEDPIYGYNPLTQKEDDFTKENVIAVMAVDNLPCEIPKDASEGFSLQFSKHIIPQFFNGDKEGILTHARVTQNKQLTSHFKYLEDYVNS